MARMIKAKFRNSLVRMGGKLAYIKIGKGKVPKGFSRIKNSSVNGKPAFFKK